MTKEKSRPKVLSVINLKGGVGKTTLTVALADVFASEFGKKVLVVDMDPQTNSTLMFIGEDKWAEIDKNKRTLFHLFDDTPKDGRPPRLGDFILTSAGTVKGAERLIDLVPSSIRLVGVQDQLVKMSPGDFHIRAPATVLRDASHSALDGYDLVLVDCPPNLGIITLNGLLISDGYIIPTIPDYLSTYGIPQIVHRVAEFSKEAGKSIVPLGIVASKCRATTVHKTTISRLRKEEDAPMFAATIAEANQFAGAAETAGMPLTFKQKWGYGGLAQQFISLAKEIRQKLEASQ